MSVLPLSQEAFVRSLGSRLTSERVPFSGTWELTWDCNFRCQHCYLEGTRRPLEALSFGRMDDLLAQLAQAGCLSLTLTGGEPLLRPDFDRILAAAVGHGFLVNVFTNASLIDENMADFMAAYPPRSVEVTLYGASPGMYERVTGMAAHFEQVLGGIDRLLQRGLFVVLKSVLLASMEEELDQLRALAEERGLRLRIDPGVDPTLSGDDAPTALRIPADRAVEAELADGEHRRDMARLMEAAPAESEFACGAGARAFHLDPLGRLMPCLLVREPAIDLAEHSFAEAWALLGQGPAIGFDPGAPCHGCDLHPICSHCPGLERLVRQAGSGREHSCQLAQKRANMLTSTGRGP